MPKFSKSSEEKLSTCHYMWQVICREAIRIIDFKVIKGYRGETEQNDAYNSIPQRSKLPFPLSKHNKMPSLAVDLAPWPIDWKNIYRFYELAGVIKTIAFQHGCKITWGGDWKTFKDYPHFQLEVE